MVDRPEAWSPSFRPDDEAHRLCEKIVSGKASRADKLRFGDQFFANESFERAVVQHNHGLHDAGQRDQSRRLNLEIETAYIRRASRIIDNVAADVATDEELAFFKESVGEEPMATIALTHIIGYKCHPSTTAGTAMTNRLQRVIKKSEAEASSLGPQQRRVSQLLTGTLPGEATAMATRGGSGRSSTGGTGRRQNPAQDSAPAPHQARSTPAPRQARSIPAPRQARSTPAPRQARSTPTPRQARSDVNDWRGGQGQGGSSRGGNDTSPPPGLLKVPPGASPRGGGGGGGGGASQRSRASGTASVDADRSSTASEESWDRARQMRLVETASADAEFAQRQLRRLGKLGR